MDQLERWLSAREDEHLEFKQTKSGFEIASLGAELRPSVERLVSDGVLERTGGRGRGARLLLSRKYYDFAGRAGEYTRKKGLDRETNKELLIRHIQARSVTGTKLGELIQVLPDLTEDQVQSLVRELKSQRKVHCIGRTRAARWFPGPQSAST